MKTLRYLAVLALLTTAPAFAGNEPEVCSNRMLAGRWMFATDVGHQSKFPGGDITAIGIFKLDRQGTLTDGIFDATVEGWRFLQGVTFTGTLTINANCTGTLFFVTSAGTQRYDSVIVLGPNHFRGMSQDTTSLWTYDARRL